MDAATRATVGMVPVALGTVLTVKVLEQIPAGDKTVGKFPVRFRTHYLSILRRSNKKVYTEAHKATRGDGNDMVVYVRDNYPDVHETVYGKALDKSI